MIMIISNYTKLRARVYCMYVTVQDSSFPILHHPYLFLGDRQPNLREHNAHLLYKYDYILKERVLRSKTEGERGSELRKRGLWMQQAVR